MRYSALIITWFVFLNLALAQNNKPQPIFFDKQTGKIFVNLHQGFYFKVSSSPNPNAKKTLLRYSSTPTVVNPLYFSHEGANIIYTPWAIDTATKTPIRPKQNVEFIVYADGTPPTVKPRFNKKPFVRNNTKFYPAPLTLEFHATDNLSGLHSIFYKINNSEQKTYSAPIQLSEQGPYLIQFSAWDNVGNQAKFKKIDFVIDASAPVTSLTINGPKKQNILAPKSQIILSATDSLSGLKKIVYIIDSIDTIKYQKPIALKHLDQGWHSIIFYAQDNVGNTQKPQIFSFFLDNTPPLILEDIIGNSYFVGDKQYLSANSKLKLTAIDNKAGVKAIYYSFDGKNWTQYTGPIPFPKTHKLVTLRYYAIDSVDNKSIVDTTQTVKGGIFATYIDLEPPTISYEFKNHYILGDTVFLSKKSLIVLKAHDKQSGLKQISYQIDTSTEVIYNKPFNLQTPGLHKITATALDNVNNFAITQFIVKVDTTPPQIKLIPSTAPRKLDPIPHFPPNIKLFITATDNAVGLKLLTVSINGAKPVPYQSLIKNLPPGKVTITVFAQDYLDNKTSKTFNLFIDKK